MNVPVLQRANVPTPASGYVYYFNDSDNSNALTYKDEDGNFFVIGAGIPMNSISAQDCACELADKIVDAASCALGKGTMTPTEYSTLVGSLNIQVVNQYNSGTNTWTTTITS